MFPAPPSSAKNALSIGISSTLGDQSQRWVEVRLLLGEHL